MLNRLILVVWFIASGFAVAGQPQITHNDLPDAGDLLVQRAAQFTGDVDLEFTGPNQNWVFGYDILQPLEVFNETNCVDVASTPFEYQIFFNNPFDPDHNSDFAVGIDSYDIGLLSLENAYFYYQNRSDRYAITGQGATINDYPTGAQGNPVDILYDLPLNYGDQDSHYSELNYELPAIGTYNVKQTRTNFCSGWGALTIWDQTFPVLYVRTEIAATDSVYIEFFQNGQSFERPLTVEYKWMSPTFKVPVLQVTTLGGVVTSVLTADISVGVEEGVITPFTLLYSALSDQLHIVGNDISGDQVSIIDASGHLVYQGLVGDGLVDMSTSATGVYFVTITGKKGRSSKSFLR